jgi:WD40 repeat protein
MLHGHTRAVLSVSFSPDGKILAAAGLRNIIPWDLKTQKPLGPPLTGHKYWVDSLAFSPDGKVLASGSEDGTIIL